MGNPVGRPKIQLPEDWKQQLIDIALAGGTRQEMREALGISRDTLWTIVSEDTEFADKLSRARREGMEERADGLYNVHNEIEDPRKADVYSRNTQFLLKTRARDVYGDKVDVNISQAIDITPTLDARRRFALPVCDQQQGRIVQDAEFAEIPHIKPTDKETVGSDSDPEEIDIFE
jgi:hypothetical protein